MNSYLRMIRMIRPYLPQAATALVFMLLFSFFSVFSFTMISPFLKALFLDTDSQLARELSVEPAAAPLAVQPDAAAGDDAARERLAGVQEKVSFVTSIKTAFQDWVEAGRPGYPLD